MKPEQHILNIISTVTDPARIRNGQMRQVISLNSYPEQMTFLLHEGTMAVYRSKDHLLMRYFEAPMIFGMNDLMDMTEGMFLKACGNIRYEIIPTKQFIELVDSNNLWKEAAYTFMYVIKRFAQVHQTTAGLTTYELIKQNLATLMDEKEDLRLTINASDYIQEKTHLSRSRVMKILSDLKIGGHIELQRGILMKVNKLPENY
ncbi:helix-turn-helix domain-containing protein [Enterobacter mori]|uniref:helix-turn-helix domain-containing protein n=1 Tax=Enterobacter mori TaxID=539813 RepID=UPI003CFBD3C3